MKKSLSIATILLLAGFFGCSDDKNLPTEYGYKVTLAQPTVVYSDYYGDNNDNGVARYQMAISLGYKKELVARTADQEMDITDVIHLTFYSPTVLDAEYALPEEGTYSVSQNSGLSALFAGQATDEGYTGTYIESTSSGQTTLSPVTAGTLVIRYSDAAMNIELDLQDEKGILRKYTDENSSNTTLTYTGKISFVNKAIDYHIFHVPGEDYNRIWYWGEATYERASVDGTPMGEYMFVFSNASYAEVTEPGHVSTSFYLMDEYQVYGMDGIIKPGLYPVEAEEDFKGKLGSIYLWDVTDPNAFYKGTATVNIFEDGEKQTHFVTDGWMAVFGDESGTPNRFVVNFTCDDGRKFHGRYDSTLAVGDEWTLSDLREDVTLENLPGAYMRIKDPDYYYRVAESNHWELFLMGEGVSVSLGEYGITISGPGDCFRFEVSTESGIDDALPAGTYNIEDSYQPGIAQQGNKSIGWIGIWSGAWFHRIISSTVDPLHSVGLSGTLTISKEGDQYTIDAILYDDAKNTIIGSYTGIPTIEDTRTVDESRSFGNRVIPGYYLTETRTPDLYRNAVQARETEAAARLKKK